MADPVAVTGDAPSGEPETAPPHSDLDLERGTRGRLTIKDRAVSRIAVAAALSVPGVVRHSGRLLTLSARDLPRADVTTGPESVAITLYLAVSWPSPLAVLSREVHATVAERVETLTGMPLEHLHVVVAAVPLPAGTSNVDARQLAAEYESDGRPVPSRPPLARPDSAVVAVVAAVLLIALGVVAGREFLIEQEVVAPAAWVRNSVHWLAEQHSQTWMVPAAIAAGVVGLIVICLALMPRTRTHVPAGGDAGDAVVWLRPTDVARMCSARAGAVGGTTGVHTTVDRKRATVHVTPTGEVAPDALAEQVRDAVAPALAAVSAPSELRVRVGKVKP